MKLLLLLALLVGFVLGKFHSYLQIRARAKRMSPEDRRTFLTIAARYPSALAKELLRMKEDAGL